TRPIRRSDALRTGPVAAAVPAGPERRPSGLDRLGGPPAHRPPTGEQRAVGPAGGPGGPGMPRGGARDRRPGAQVPPPVGGLQRPPGGYGRPGEYGPPGEPGFGEPGYDDRGYGGRGGGGFDDAGDEYGLDPATAAMPAARPAAWPGDDVDDYGDDAYADDGYGDDGYYDEYDEIDDEADDLPRRKGCRNALVALAVLVVLAMVAGWFAWSWAQDKIDPPGEPGEVVIVDIPEGTTTAGVGDILADAEVITDSGMWGWYTRLREVGTIQAGRYEMRLNSSFAEAIDDLGNDPFPPDSRLVTIPEGLTQAQIAERLADPETGVPGFTVEGVEAALADPASRSPVLPENQPLLEGTLFPETYAVEDGDTEADVIQRMVAQFDDVAADLQLQSRAEAVGLSPYEVVIVASMIEREAGIVEDGPRIARVIYNRIEAGEPLGIDATSCYEKGEIPCTLTDDELTDNTPYDTREQTGLTPTPIASPGRASLEAALAPADGDWRWYVLDAEKNDGSSYFTNDYDDFLAAKQRCTEAGLGCG
ncbi:MAG TPA: endolytic transglycosylase MltG, partial [Acidimicrobiales bacterium]|nr:endolytic transglycosylase MltG [Acidimicrobiales bacterium]